MASKTLIDVNQVVKNTHSGTKAAPNSIDVTKDLLQRLAELTAKTTEFIEKVDGIEPAMNTIYNLSPLQQAPGRCSIFIPEIGTVELILNTEEVQPFHTGKDRGIDDQILVGL